MTDQQIYIGVDGGGTGCRVAIGTRGRIIARAQGGPANATTDPVLAINNVVATVADAAGKIADTDLSQAIVHVGLAGVMTDRDARKIAGGLPYGRCNVTDDRTTTVVGALGSQDGFLLSVGTGTIAAASKNGVQHYVGGWGLVVSDHGSGAWLGRAALEQVLLCHDGLSQHTPLTHEIFAQFTSNPNAIVTFCTDAKPQDYAALAPKIVTSDDPWAVQIMRKGAAYLAQSLDALSFTSGDPLCLMGGVGLFYRDHLPAPYLSGLVAPKGSAVDGAFQMACNT